LATISQTACMAGVPGLTWNVAWHRLRPVERLLFAWLGKTDLAAVEGKAKQGPILEVVSNRTFDELHILADCPEADAARYQDWLSHRGRDRAPYLRDVCRGRGHRDHRPPAQRGAWASTESAGRGAIRYPRDTPPPHLAGELEWGKLQKTTKHQRHSPEGGTPSRREYWLPGQVSNLRHPD